MNFMNKNIFDGREFFLNYPKFRVIFSDISMRYPWSNWPFFNKVLLKEIPYIICSKVRTFGKQPQDFPLSKSSGCANPLAATTIPLNLSKERPIYKDFKGVENLPLFHKSFLHSFKVLYER